MGPSPSKQASELLVGWKQVDRQALDAVFPVVYSELRRLAHYHLRQRRSNHTLQTTALVHEAYVRLAGQRPLTIENRVHFLGVAAQLMRWILVDYERQRLAAKRGGGSTRLLLDGEVAGVGSAGPRNVDLMALDSALDKLAKLDAQQGQIVELRYFGGLSIEDTAEFLEVSPASVKRGWASARAWLLREMSRGASLA